MNDLDANCGIDLPPGQGHERPTSGVRRSKVKVTGGRSYVWKAGGDIILDPLSWVDAVTEENAASETRGWSVAPPPFVDMRLADALVFMCICPGTDNSATMPQIGVKFCMTGPRIPNNFDGENGKLQRYTSISDQHSATRAFYNVRYGTVVRLRCPNKAKYVAF